MQLFMKHMPNKNDQMVGFEAEGEKVVWTDEAT